MRQKQVEKLRVYRCRGCATTSAPVALATSADGHRVLAGFENGRVSLCGL